MNFGLVAVALLFSAQMSDGGTAALTPGTSELATNREAPQGANNSEGVDANGERRICRRITASRTHQYRRVCMTARQWREYNDQNS